MQEEEMPEVPQQSEVPLNERPGWHTFRMKARRVVLSSNAVGTIIILSDGVLVTAGK